MAKQPRNAKYKNNTHRLSAAALITALMCIVAPLSFPVGSVPVSLTNLIIYLSVYIHGTKIGTISCLVYILLGAAGMPVFSGFSSGIYTLAGVTGGYIIGFIPMAFVSGCLISKTSNKIFNILAFVLGTSICYLTGTIWFCNITNVNFISALWVCVLPFIGFDVIKIIFAVLFGFKVKKILTQLNLL